MRPMKKTICSIILILAIGLSAGLGHAAGILTPIGSRHQPIQIRDHHVNVVINNGFAMTEVHQTFYNPNTEQLEAMYSFPLPKSASLSEVTIYVGEREIQGEVLEKIKARKIYEDEKSKGNESSLAEKNEFYTFEFKVFPVPANDETRIRFLYYQPLTIDTGIGRYLYPLEEGGTDEEGMSFWTTNAKVENTFSMNLELKSAYPVQDVRVPGFEAATTITELEEGHYKLEMQLTDMSLTRDLIFYYRLKDGLPGRVEVIPFRDDKKEPGTFMMVITPGVDLKPLVKRELKSANWAWALFFTIGLMALLAKVTYESVTGQTIFVANTHSGMVPVPLSHLVGGFVGFIIGLGDMTNKST